MIDQWMLSFGVASCSIALLLVMVSPASNLPWTIRILLLILGSAALQMSLVGYGQIEQLTALIFLMDPLDIAFAPLAYLYLRNLNGRPLLKWRVGLHFLPSLIAILATAPFWFSHSEVKLSIYRAGIDFTNWRWPSDEGTVWVIIVQLLLYSPFVLIEYHRRVRNYHGQVPMHRVWLHWFVGCYYGLWLLVVAFALLQFQVAIRHTLLLGVLCFVVSFLIALLRGSSTISGERGRETRGDVWRSDIGQNDVADLADRLHQYMRVSRCYLDGSLSLQELARQMNTQSVKLTRVFNQHLNTGFYDYINDYRVKAAKQMLRDPERKLHSVTDIMLASGFSSNSVFYANFKEATGLTPAQYRKENTSEGSDNPVEGGFRVV